MANSQSKLLKIHTECTCMVCDKTISLSISECSKEDFKLRAAKSPATVYLDRNASLGIGYEFTSGKCQSCYDAIYGSSESGC